MKTSTLTLAALLFSASSAVAQTHPCDVSDASSGTVNGGAPLTLGFCARPDEQIQAAVVYVDGNARSLVKVAPISAANSAGWAYYEVPIGSFGKGSYVLRVTVYNTNSDTGQLQESALSAPFALAVVEATVLPTAPQIKKVSK